uniref:IREH1/IRE-like N-terminal domain-containing protein n=1 Tax=Nelumbo nucifera TaxID=4432 RepID=A0A822XB18_NELNU|nr:TPA_asm: hypothetical protein HUJ06_020067 [Nelumbo nucifera]
MSSLPTSSDPSDSRDQNANPNNGDSSAAPPVSSTTTTTTKFKTRKIPQIPIHRSEVETSEIKEASDGSDEMELGPDDPSPILASFLGLNPIRTRSAPSPLRFSSPPVASPNQTNEKNESIDEGNTCPKFVLPHHPSLSGEPGKRSHWIQSKSFRVPMTLNPGLEGFDTAKEFQSPRFQAIMRVTSGRRKRTPDIRSFSHELNSKGLRPFPLWKSRTLGHIEEIMVVIRAKFVRLKEEVDSELGIFAGDLMSILEKNVDAHPKWRETLEDLLVIARKCAKMSATEFWSKCEAIVQNLDDRRQELPMGTLKQAHTRILFILTRCTRLLQFDKEGGFEDEHILGLHQLSDLGVYSEQFFGAENPRVKSSLSGKEANEKHTDKSHGQEQSNLDLHQDQDDQHLSYVNASNIGNAKSRDRIPSWKKSPSSAEKSRREGIDEKDSQAKDKLESSGLLNKMKLGVDKSADNTPQFPPGNLDNSSNAKRVSWGFYGDQQNIVHENSMICRICEVEIPTVHVEDHSRICTISDRCDLKGLTVNERLERVAETLEKILETCTPKGSDAEQGSPDVSSSIAEDFDPVFPEQSSEDLLDCLPETDGLFIMDDIKSLPDMSSKMGSIIMPDQGTASSSAGSSTPRSPLLTPRTNQIELLLSGRNAISELEDFQQLQLILRMYKTRSELYNL